MSIDGIRGRLDHVQRLFSVFPSGAPGLGLLLLRTVAGGVAVSAGISVLSASRGSACHVGLCGAGPVVIGALLTIGLATPFAGIVLGISLTTCWFLTPADGVAVSQGVPLLLAAVCVALALLGPGRFSLDARLFGRREILIP